MKVTRSYWLGLGSGLILSAMLMLTFSPLQGQAVDNPQAPPLTEEVKESDSSLLVETPEGTQPQEKQPELQTSTRISQDFVIPKGASAEKIAELLFSQDLIKDKATFLERAHQMGAERQFKAGTFNLSLGLNEEDLIQQLLK